MTLTMATSLRKPWSSRRKLKTGEDATHHRVYPAAATSALEVEIQEKSNLNSADKLSQDTRRRIKILIPPKHLKTQVSLWTKYLGPTDSWLTMEEASSLETASPHIRRREGGLIQVAAVNKTPGSDPPNLIMTLILVAIEMDMLLLGDHPRKVLHLETIFPPTPMSKTTTLRC
jgi:hypothetical protein